MEFLKTKGIKVKPTKSLLNLVAGKKVADDRIVVVAQNIVLIFEALEAPIPQILTDIVNKTYGVDEDRGGEETQS
jgi:hypothetical protein